MRSSGPFCLKVGQSHLKAPLTISKWHTISAWPLKVLNYVIHITWTRTRACDICKIPGHQHNIRFALGRTHHQSVQQSESDDRISTSELKHQFYRGEKMLTRPRQTYCRIRKYTFEPLIQTDKHRLKMVKRRAMNNTFAQFPKLFMWQQFLRFWSVRTGLTTLLEWLSLLQPAVLSRYAHTRIV